MPPQIIMPQGKPVARIIIEIDAKGQATVKAGALDHFGREIQPLPMIQVCLVMSQVLSNSILGFFQAAQAGFPKPIADTPEGGSDGASS